MRTPISRSRSLLLTGAAALGASALAVGVATSSNASAAGVPAGGAFAARVATTTTPKPTPKPVPTTKPIPTPTHPASHSRKSVRIGVKVAGKTTSGVYHGMLTATLTSGRIMLSGEQLTLHVRHDAKAAWKVAGHALSAPKTGKATFVLTQRDGVDQYEVTVAATATYAAATSSVITVHRH